MSSRQRKQWNFSRSCKGGKYEYDSLLSTTTTWNRARFRKHSKQSNAEALKSLSIHYRKVSWVLSQFTLAFKESINKFGYLVSLPKQLEKMNQKGKNRLTGGTLTTHRKWSLSGKGEDGGLEGWKSSTFRPTAVCNYLMKANSPTCLHHPWSQGRKPGTHKKTIHPVCSLIYTLNNSIKEMTKIKKFYCLNKASLD